MKKKKKKSVDGEWKKINVVLHDRWGKKGGMKKKKAREKKYKTQRLRIIIIL